MESPSSPPLGMLAALRTLGDGLIAGLQQRLRLFALEVQEEKFRLIQTFVWISAAVFAGMMTVLCASLTLVYLFWESARLAVFAGLTVFYAAALAAILLALRRFIARQPDPFAGTLEELGEDRACIRTRN